MIRFDRRAKIALLGLVVMLGLLALTSAWIGWWKPRQDSSDGTPVAEQRAVTYLSPSQSPELWTTAPDGSQPRQLTETGGRLYDYSIAADGAKIVFSAYNEQNGIDIWEISPQGGAPFLLLPCGADWCYNPAYAPDGSKVAYSRRKASGLPGSQPGAPQVWLIERATLQTDVLFVDPAIGGHSPLWSPGGRYLAFVDDLQQGVRVADFQQTDPSAPAAGAQGDFFLETGPGDSFSWSPDSLRLYFTLTESSGDHPDGSIYTFDTETRQENLWMGEEGAEYSVPAWSPDGGLAVVAYRGLNQGAGRQLWLVGKDGSQVQAISADPRVNHAGYSWDSDGALLVFQRVELNSSASLPEIWIWSRADGQSRRLAADAIQPRWFP